MTARSCSVLPCALAILGYAATPMKLRSGAPVFAARSAKRNLDQTRLAGVNYF